MAKITKECIQLALEKIVKNFINQAPPGSEKFQKNNVRYNRNTKKISVTHDFRLGRIPKVKIIATREDWFKIYDSVTLQKKIKKHSFDIIRDFLYRCPKRKKEELKRYTEEDPKGFLDDLLNYAVAAHKINPIQYFQDGEYHLYGKRKSSFPDGDGKDERYRLSRREKYEIASMADRLYVYLRYDLSNKSPKQWPSYVKKFLDKYEISDAKNHLKEDRLKGYVKIVMAKYFGPKFGDRFWQTVVVEGRIKSKRLRELKRINPEEDPLLKELFKEFM